MDAKIKKVAVLIDAENVSLKYLDKIFERAKSEGYVCFKRIYGNVTVRKNGVNPLLEYGITHIQCYSYVPDKNTADMVLAVDAMDQLYKNGVDVFCIVSSDSDFAPLVNKIIEEGKTVIGMGESKAVRSFRNSCNEFILLDEGEENITPYDQVKSDIETILTESEDSPVRFKLISDKLNKKYYFDPDNYDCDTMVELIEKMGFDITFKNNFGKRTYYASMPKEEAEIGTEAEEAVSESEKSEDIENIENIEDIENTEGPPETTEETADGTETAPVETGTEGEASDAPEEAESEQTAEGTPSESDDAADLLDILSAHITDTIKNNANSKGYMPLSALVSALQKRIPNFSAKKFGYSNTTKLFEAMGCELKDKGSKNASVRLGRALTADELPKPTPQLEELQQRIAVIAKKHADKDGWCMLSKIITVLKAEDPDFSTMAYGSKTSVALVERLPSVELEKRYKNNKNSGPFDAYVRISDGSEAKTDELLSQKKLTEDIIEIIKTKGNADGRMAITHVIMELTNRYPGFSIKKYNLGNATNAMRLLGFDTANNYVGLGIHRTSDETEETTVNTEVIDTEEIETEAKASEETAPETDTNTENESEAETESAETTEISETTEEIPEAAEENSDEQEFSKNGIPLYVDLPEAIDTKEQLRNAIIFILSTESVTSATRLSAPLKRYYPDFKIKNYGHNKMKSLLEDLGLFVF